MQTLIERAQERAKDISASRARGTAGIELELLAEILIESRITNGRLPPEKDVPRTWLRLFKRFKRWMTYQPKGEIK